MKLRLRTRLEDARANAGTEARPRFEQALSELETAHIASIHAFCAELLRKRPIEARIDPAFNVIAEEEERELLDRVFDRWLTGVLESRHRGEASAEASRRRYGALREAAPRRPYVGRAARLRLGVAAARARARA